MYCDMLVMMQCGNEGDRIGDSHCCVVTWVLMTAVTRRIGRASVIYNDVCGWNELYPILR